MSLKIRVRVDGTYSSQQIFCKSTKINFRKIGFKLDRKCGLVLKFDQQIRFGPHFSRRKWGGQHPVNKINVA